MRAMLKILNPFIWFWNWFQYTSHLNFFAENGFEYEPYDFSKDLKYF